MQLFKKGLINAESMNTESAATTNTPRKVYTMTPESCKFSHSSQYCKVSKKLCNKNRTNNLSTSTQTTPNCPFLPAATHIVVGSWRVSNWSICADVSRVNLTVHAKCSFIANNKITEKIFVSSAPFC